MGKVEIRMEELVPRYVDAALSLAGKNLLLESFELKLRETLSQQTGIP